MAGRGRPQLLVGGALPRGGPRRRGAGEDLLYFEPRALKSVLRRFGAQRQLVSKAHGRVWRGGQGLGIVEVRQRAGEWGAEASGECVEALTLLAAAMDFSDMRFSLGVSLGCGYEVRVSRPHVLRFLDAEVAVGLGNAEDAGPGQLMQAFLGEEQA